MADVHVSAPGMAAAFSAIARAAKAHWGYPAEWLDLWSGDLEVTPAQIAEGGTFHVEVEGVPVGFVRLSVDGSVAELEGLWVDPPHIGRGYGGRLLRHAMARAADRGATVMRIVSDPNAAVFYERFGAREVGSAASVPAGRRLPVLLLELTPPD